MEHVCGVISGEKIVFTSLPSEPGRLGWVLPCEAFKGRPVLLGHHCENIGDGDLKDILKTSKYLEIARWFANIWFCSGAFRVESCLGQWILTVTDESGNIVHELVAEAMTILQNAKD